MEKMAVCDRQRDMTESWHDRCGYVKNFRDSQVVGVYEIGYVNRESRMLLLYDSWTYSSLYNHEFVIVSTVQYGPIHDCHRLTRHRPTEVAQLFG